jgi:hypothetical protein
MAIVERPVPVGWAFEPSVAPESDYRPPEADRDVGTQGATVGE